MGVPPTEAQIPLTPQIVEVTGPGEPAFDGLVAVQRAHDAALWPDDPPVPTAEAAAHLFSPPADRRVRAWLATVDGEPAAMAHTRERLHSGNEGVVRVEISVPPAWRRRGLGRRLAAQVLPVLAAGGATSVFSWPLDAAGEAFSAGLGMTARQQDGCNRLRIADLDADQQRAWIDDAPARGAGYRLVGWVGATPDEWLEPLARALEAMVDAPTDDFDWQPESMTAAQVRGGEQALDAAGYDMVRTLALAPDGSAAGMSELMVSRLRPALARQGDTGVIAAHRGLRLGRWLKAANLRRALDHQPAVAVVETFNATSNDHMAAINEAMGFRRYRTFSTWQGPIDRALAAAGA